jgi:hypothetical protein
LAAIDGEKSARRLRSAALISSGLMSNVVTASP